jgi:predicted ATPase
VSGARQHHLLNLPIPLTSFVGRQDELAAIARMLHEYRLLTLTGAGGVGKTRLALHAAADERAHNSDGVWFVELAAVATPDLTPGKVAYELGITAEPGRSVTDALCSALQARDMLLILDNCEHLLEPCADLVTMLLARCPHLTVLATSREPLAVAGEAVFPVPPLPSRGTRSSGLGLAGAFRCWAPLHRPCASGNWRVSADSTKCADGRADLQTTRWLAAGY